jgi:hypothetical protein
VAVQALVSIPPRFAMAGRLVIFISFSGKTRGSFKQPDTPLILEQAL